MNRIVAVTLCALFMLPSSMLFAMNDLQRREFERIANLGMTELTEEASRALEKKYPGESWSVYNFPAYAESRPSVATAYRIAVKDPELLGDPDVGMKDTSVPCYCFCEAMGHRNLLYCFWKDGIADGQFDDHAASCDICVGQAMLAFLWAELGASREEIRAGMERKFHWLLEKHQEDR